MVNAGSQISKNFLMILNMLYCILGEEEWLDNDKDLIL